MGQNLASYLNNQIDSKTTDDAPRSDIITSMASAADIEASTVNEILSGDIDCPPLDRLEGFADALDVSANSVVSAAEEDGCSYEEERKRSMFSQFTDWLKRELGLTQRRIKDVDSWDGSSSRWETSESYCSDCLIDLNPSGEEKTKSLCKLPIREPGDSSDTFVRQAVHAAAVRFSQVDAPEEEKAKAARRLVTIYNEMDEDPPESIIEVAERQKRVLGLSQLFDQLRMQLDNMYGWDHWLLDLFYDADNTPFIVLTSGGKLFRHTVMIETDTATLGEAIPVMQEFIPTVRTTTTIKRQADGRWRWYSISASSVLNRVGEIDSRELFDSFEAHSLETGEYPIRQFYHAGEVFRTGQADFLARDDNLYITSGLYDNTDIAEREVKARQKEPNYWGDSIGYLPTSKPEFLEVAENVSIPVYRAGINKEISTLPEKDAANLFTANTEVLGVRRMLDQRQMDAWIKLFDGDEEAAKSWLEQNAESRNRQIEQNDLITRGLFEAITNKFYEGDKEKAKEWLEENGLIIEVEGEQLHQELELVSELSDEDIARALGQSEPIQQMINTLEDLANKLTENETANQQRQKQLTDGLQDLATRIEALEADDETKQREWLQNQPRRFSNGGVKHIIRPRVARAAEGEGEPESFADVAKQNLENKRIPSY